MIQRSPSKMLERVCSVSKERKNDNLTLKNYNYEMPANTNSPEYKMQRLSIKFKKDTEMIDTENKVFDFQELKKTAKIYKIDEDGKKSNQYEKVKASEKFDQNILEQLKRQKMILESLIEFRDKSLVFLRKKKESNLKKINNNKTEVIFNIIMDFNYFVR